MLRKIGATACVFVFPFVVSSALASDFQHQLSGNWFDTNYADLQSYSLQYRYFWPATTTSNLPYQQQSILSRRSSVGLSYLGSEFSSSWNNHNWKLKGWQWDGEYQSAAHNVFAALSYLRLHHHSADKISGRLGYYLQSDWLVTLDVERESIRDNNYWYQGVSSQKFWGFNNGDGVSFTAKYLRRRGPSSDGWQLAADYYFGKAISLGLIASSYYSDRFLVSDNNISVRGSWFITPAFEVNASAGIEDVSDADYTWQLGASLRF